MFLITMMLMDINFNRGEWYVLARTNRILSDIGNKLQDEGYMFWREGSGWSVSEQLINSIEAVDTIMQRSKSKCTKLGREFSKRTKKGIIEYGGKRKIEQLDQSRTYTLDDLLNTELGSLLNLNKEMMWYDVLIYDGSTTNIYIFRQEEEVKEY